MNLWQERTILMFGDESVEKLAKSNILVVGVGGVGAYAAEMLVRAGVGHLTLVDGDVVSDTNRNRQLIALKSTVGCSKVEVLAERLLDINPDVKLRLIHEYFRVERTIEGLES